MPTWAVKPTVMRASSAVEWSRRIVNPTIRRPQRGVHIAVSIDPRPRKDMRLISETVAVGIGHDLEDGRVEIHRRVEHDIMLEEVPGDEPRPGLMREHTALEERPLDLVHRVPDLRAEVMVRVTVLWRASSVEDAIANT